MKLIDFGLAAFYAPGKKLRVHCGSPSYAAPEIVARKLYEGPPVDVWSLGVVLFAMMAGFLPFHSPTGNKQVRLLYRLHSKATCCLVRLQGVPSLCCGQFISGLKAYIVYGGVVSQEARLSASPVMCQWFQ